MKKYLLLFCSLITAQLYAQSIEGSWMGLVDAGTAKIRLVFNITKTSSGYTSTFDSPDQNAFGIATGKTQLSADSIYIEIPAILGGYKGKFNGTNEIIGYYYQAKSNTNLNLLK